MVTLDTFKPVDLAILGVSGFLLLLGLLAAALAIPWNIKRWRQSGALELNILWPVRATLAVTVAAWMTVQTLRLDSIWGATSIILPTYASEWTGEGWLCRIYLTAALGVGAPLAAFLTLHILATGARRQQLGELELANPTVHQTRTNAKIMALATLSTLPIALAQAAVAWLSVWVKYDGAPLEQNPRSVLGIFFAVYRYADDPETQCASAADSTECVLCAFPAAAVAVQAVWVVPFLIALWVVYQRLTLKAVNVTLARRLFLFCALVTSFSLSGVGALGASIAFNPFSWVNQALWIAYASTAACTALAILIFMAILPSVTLRYVSKAMHAHNDKLSPLPTLPMYKSFSAAGPPPGYDPSPPTPDSYVPRKDSFVNPQPFHVVDAYASSPPAYLPLGPASPFASPQVARTGSRKQHKGERSPGMVTPTSSALTDLSSNPSLNPWHTNAFSQPLAYHQAHLEPAASPTAGSSSRYTGSNFTSGGGLLPTSTRPYSAGGTPLPSHQPASPMIGSSSYGGYSGASSPSSSLTGTGYNLFSVHSRPSTAGGGSPYRALHRPTGSYGSLAASPSFGARDGRVPDTNPISNPLWFQSGLPPSYHHSPQHSSSSLV